MGALETCLDCDGLDWAAEHDAEIVLQRAGQRPFGHAIKRLGSDNGGGSPKTRLLCFLARFMHMEMVAVVESDYPVSRFPVSQGTMFQWSYSSTAFSDVKMLSMKLFHVSQSL